MEEVCLSRGRRVGRAARPEGAGSASPRLYHLRTLRRGGSAAEADACFPRGCVACLSQSLA